MDISEVVKRSGVPASTLRYYEQIGLVIAGRATGGRRQYSKKIFDQLALIALGQAGGLSLTEIKQMLSPSGNLDIDREVLIAKADQLDKTIKKLKSMSKGLRHAAVCPANNHIDCPKFQKLMKVAASRVKEI